MSWSSSTAPRFLLGGLLLLAACSSGASEKDVAYVDPCLDAPAGSALPAGCTGDPDPTSSPPAEGSSAYDGLRIDPAPGLLAAGGNDVTVALTTQTFTVTVPAGQRLRVQAVCQGQARMTVTVDPGSEAATEFACGLQEPRESTVEEPTPTTAPTVFTVVATAPAPSRWYAAVSAV